MIFLISAVFILGYAFIVMEHRFHVHKSITATALGGVLWVLIAMHERQGAEEALEVIGSEIFSLIAFLIAAMTLVEILVHYRFFDLVRIKLQRLGLADSRQLWLISGVAFVLSAVIDNLTTTIVMIQIARRFFKGKNLLVAASAIVIAANAGGAFSPIGDVTTIMLWLAGKFSVGDIVGWGILPAIALVVVSVRMLSGKISSDTADVIEEDQQHFHLSRSERIVITSGFLSFSFPLIAHLSGLPPYLGLLFGLGVTGSLMAFFAGNAKKKETHLSAEIETLLRGVDFASILFFIGILLAVGALRHLGILAAISESVFGAAPDLFRLIFGNTFLGVFSAIVDNIPLTAAAIDIVSSNDPAIWVLLALAVGTGGSILVIGSAAGVVAMGLVKELTFKRYVEVASLPAAVGYAVAIAVWYGQYLLLR